MQPGRLITGPQEWRIMAAILQDLEVRWQTHPTPLDLAERGPQFQMRLMFNIERAWQGRHGPTTSQPTK